MRVELPLNALTPRMRRILIAAGREALAAEQRYIGTEHVLLALALDDGGLAAHVLGELDVREQVRAAARAAIDREGPGGEAGHPEDEAVVRIDPLPLSNHPLRIVKSA